MLPASLSDANKFVAETLGRQENRDPKQQHGCVVRPTMFRVRLDIKTAFDDAKQARGEHNGKARKSRVADIESFEGDVRTPRKSNFRGSRHII